MRQGCKEAVYQRLGRAAFQLHIDAGYRRMFLFPFASCSILNLTLVRPQQRDLKHCGARTSESRTEGYHVRPASPSASLQSGTYWHMPVSMHLKVILKKNLQILPSPSFQMLRRIQVQFLALVVQAVSHIQCL
jgi:hypothetical protein